MNSENNTKSYQRMDTEKIIGNLLRMGDPTLPIVHIPVKEMFGKCAYILIYINSLSFSVSWTSCTV